MAITVCDLEVPVCWLGYRKASKSWWEIILFGRFLQHLSKTLELIIDLLAKFLIEQAELLSDSMITGGVELQT